MGEIKQHPETTWQYWFDPDHGEVTWGIISPYWTDDWDAIRSPSGACSICSTAAWFSDDSARALADWILNPPEQEVSDDDT